MCITRYTRIIPIHEDNVKNFCKVEDITEIFLVIVARFEERFSKKNFCDNEEVTRKETRI